MNRGFYAYTLSGWTRCIESAISGYLPRGQAVRFDPNALLRGDAKARLETYNLGRQAGLWSADDIRAQEELSPIPGGKGAGYLQPLNFTELGSTPDVVPMPKSIQEVTEPGAKPQGQEAEPPGIGSVPRSLTPQCLLGPDGRPHYYDPHTGEEVIS